MRALSNLDLKLSRITITTTTKKRKTFDFQISLTQFVGMVMDARFNYLATSSAAAQHHRWTKNFLRCERWRRTLYVLSKIRRYLCNWLARIHWVTKRRHLLSGLHHHCGSFSVNVCGGPLTRKIMSVGRALWDYNVTSRHWKRSFWWRTNARLHFSGGRANSLVLLVCTM